MPSPNGHAKKRPELSTPPADLKELREQTRRARLTARLRQSEFQTQLYESLWWDNYGDFSGSDLWDRLRPQSQDVDAGAGWVPLSVPRDRAHGENWPIWRTEQDLDRLRQRSRMLLASNGLAQSLARNLTNFVVDEGFTYQVQSKEKLPGQAEPGSDNADAKGARIEGWVKAAQDVVDRFLEVNRWNAAPPPAVDDDSPAVSTREREIFRRVLRDGESFIRFFEDEEAHVLITRFVEPECVRQPPGALVRDGWSYGVRHQMDPYEDVEKRIAYHVYYADIANVPRPGADGEKQTPVGDEIPAAEIMHVLGPDADATVARGCPFFAFGTADALERAEKLQRNASIGAAVRAATAEIWKHTVGTQAQISGLATGLADAVRNVGPNGTPEPVERARPGRVRRIPAGQEPVFPAPDNTAAYLTAAEGDKQYAAAAACGPSYWLGDQASANYSNLETASAPPVKNGQAVQGHFARAFARVVWRALQYAVKCGILEAESLAALDLEVTGAAVLHRNELEDAQVKTAESQAGVLSPQTWCAEKGRDYEIETANIEEHKERTGGVGDALGLPSGDEPPGAGGGKPPAKPGAGAMESALLESGFSGTVTDTAGHKRHYVDGHQVKGQPEPAAGGGHDPGGGGTDDRSRALAGAVRELQSTPAGRRALVRGKQLAVKIAGGMRAAITKGLDALDKGSGGGVSLIAHGVGGMDPAAVAHGVSQLVNSVFTEVHEEIFENALSAASFGGAHAAGAVAAGVAARGEKAILMGVVWAMQKARKGLGITEALESVEGVHEWSEAQIQVAVAAALDALRTVYTEAGVKVPLPDAKALTTRIAGRLKPGAGLKESKDAEGREHKGKGPGGGQFGKGGGSAGGGKKATKKVEEKAPSEKAARAKAAHVMVDADIQRYAEEHNEPAFAAAVGGKPEADNKPYDVLIGAKKPAHGIELKTMVKNGNFKITMKRSAMERKAAFERETGATFHTVVFDDHKVKDAKGPGIHDESQRVMYYRRGSGSFRVGSMHRVKDMAELRRLMKADAGSLPPAARPSPQWVQMQGASK